MTKRTLRGLGSINLRCSDLEQPLTVGPLSKSSMIGGSFHGACGDPYRNNRLARAQGLGGVGAQRMHGSDLTNIRPRSGSAASGAKAPSYGGLDGGALRRCRWQDLRIN